MSRKLCTLAIFILAATIVGCQASALTPTGESEFSITPSASASAPTNTAPPVYNWRGTTLTLNAALPAGPDDASVLLGHPDSPVTLEDARALADQFGMQGQIYVASSGVPGFTVVDGNRRFMVQSDYHFIYYPNHFNYWVSDTANQMPENAEALMAAFMQEYGFDLDYTVSYSSHYSAYFALPLSPDGFPMRFPHFAASGFQFRFDSDGIVSVDATLLKVEPVGSYGIISVDEALQKLLSPDPKYGTLEGFTSPSISYLAWSREYPWDETITMYGYLSSVPSAEGGDPLLSLDGYTVTGDTSGIPVEMADAYVEATGHFYNQGNTDFFALDSWSAQAPQEGWLGTLENRGDDVVLVTTERGELVMPDVPADVPLPLENVYALGVTVGDAFEWNAFDLRMANGGGGGGGGGGLGFYDVNLSGTPMPIPTLASAQPSIGERLEGVRGTIIVSYFTQPDGSQRVEYAWLYMREGLPYPTVVGLHGSVLDGLQPYHNQPVEIWGEITGSDQYGTPYVDVERAEVPFTNLQFQILQGTQLTMQLEGQSAILFTSDDGEQYIQVMSGGGLDTSLLGIEGDSVLLEVLIVPDETVGGYPTAHVFAGSMATSPKNGESMELEITASQPAVMDELQPQVQETYEAPTASIDGIELAYLIPYPSYGLPDSDFYIQPMWHFTGHYSSGDEFEVFVQALKPEYLSPEIVTVEPPG